MDEPMMEPLEISIHQVGDVVVLTPVGEIDVWTAPTLRQSLRDLQTGSRPRVVVDLTAVPFIDSTGIGVLVGALRRTRDMGGDFALVVVAKGVLKLLEITKLDQVFTIHATLSEAVTSSAVPVPRGDSNE
jgi:anti-sigma B factor antagonist